MPDGENLILIKRNNVSGTTPSIDTLKLGELAVNTADGKLFINTELNSVTSIKTFLNSEDQPYHLNDSLSSVLPKYGNNSVSEAFSVVLGGYNNDITGGGSSVVNGEDNDITSDFSFIGSGLNNKIYGDNSAILAGKNNIIYHSDSFIIGSDITSHESGFTYVNNLSVLGKIYGDGSEITGIVGGGNGNGGTIDSAVRELTSNWESTYTSVLTNSSIWDKTTFDLNSLSANWESSYTTVSANSSIWGMVPVSNPLKFKFLGDGITKNFTVSGTNNSDNPSYVDVYVENVKQEPITSYTLSSEIVSFVSSPEYGTEIVILTPNVKLYNILLNDYSTPYFDIGTAGSPGPMGLTGKSAYDIWLELGYVGNKQDFLYSLLGNNGTDGLDGKSAYEIWKDNGGLGDEQDFLIAIAGQAGSNGASAYEIWANTYNNSGSVEDFLNSLIGKSAYQIWKDEGNSGSVIDFLNSLKGERGDTGDKGDTGDNGKSSYQLAVDNGFTGSLQEYLISLVGPAGEKGDTVVNTDLLVEGNNNLFYRIDRVLLDSPVKSVNTQTGNVLLSIDDIPNLTTTLNSKQVTGNYVELVDNMIPSIYIPGSVDEIQEYTDYHTLTSTGSELQSILYLTLNNNKVYRWSGSTYVEIVGSPGTTDNLSEGAYNKYFTTQRVIDAAPVKSVANKQGDVLLDIQDIANLQPSLTSTNTITTPITAKLSSPFGAYINNSVIPANTSFETILRNMLTTVIPAVYTQPSLNVSVSPNVLSYEIGSYITPTLTPTFNKGNAGNATKFNVKIGSAVLSSTSTSTNVPFITSFFLTSNVTFTTEVLYLSGEQLYDNINNPSGTPLLSGIKTANTTFTTFRYNYYTSDTNPLSASSSSEIKSYESTTTSRSFTINVTQGDRRVSFAFPTSISNPNVVVKIGGVLPVTSSFTSSLISVSGANNLLPTNYYVYTSIPDIPFPQNEFYDVTF